MFEEKGGSPSVAIITFISLRAPYTKITYQNASNKEWRNKRVLTEVRSKLRSKLCNFARPLLRSRAFSAVCSVSKPTWNALYAVYRRTDRIFGRHLSWVSNRYQVSLFPYLVRRFDRPLPDRVSVANINELQLVCLENVSIKTPPSAVEFASVCESLHVFLTVWCMFFKSQYWRASIKDQLFTAVREGNCCKCGSSFKLILFKL